MNSKVSVIVPCYNQAPYLAEALESVYNQSYNNWECIIVDDGSTDNSASVAEQFTKKDSRFKYFLINNSGVSHARNFGIRQCDGAYILPLDGDDKISADFLQECVKHIQDASVKLVYSKTVTFGAAKGKWADKPYDYQLLLQENLICCTAMYRKTDFEKTRGYNENMKQGLEDWDFWLTLLNKESKVVRVDSITLYYRRKESSRSKELSDAITRQLRRQIIRNHQDLYDENLPDLISLYREKYYREKSWLTYTLKNWAKKLLNR